MPWCTVAPHVMYLFIRFILVRNFNDQNWKLFNIADFFYVNVNTRPLLISYESHCQNLYINIIKVRHSLQKAQNSSKSFKRKKSTFH